MKKKKTTTTNHADEGEVAKGAMQWKGESDVHKYYIDSTGVFRWSPVLDVR